MLNNVKIFFMILYVSVKLTWTGKVQEMTGKVQEMTGKVQEMTGKVQ